MREIKFRAWDNVADEMFYCGENVDILFMLGSAGIECTDIRNVSPSGDGVDDMEHLNYMQFTGLYDKNGKEIYEGDIIKHRYHDDPQEILWDERILGYKLLPSESVLQKVDEDRGLFEIIGNRFEHPDLLGESK